MKLILGSVAILFPLVNGIWAQTDAVRHVGSTDTFVGYAPQLEHFILPQSEDVEKAVQNG